MSKRPFFERSYSEPKEILNHDCKTPHLLRTSLCIVIVGRELHHTALESMREAPDSQ